MNTDSLEDKFWSYFPLFIGIFPPYNTWSKLEEKEGFKVGLIGVGIGIGKNITIATEASLTMMTFGRLVGLLFIKSIVGVFLLKQLQQQQRQKQAG